MESPRRQHSPHSRSRKGGRGGSPSSRNKKKHVQNKEEEDQPGDNQNQHGKAARHAHPKAGGRSHHGHSSPSNKHSKRVKDGHSALSPSSPKAHHAPAPNFFLSFRIQSETIIQNVRNMQAFVLEKFPELKPCMIDPISLHITLFVMHLNGESEIKKAGTLLKSCEKLLQEAFDGQSPSFKFSKLSTFSHNFVIYCEMEQSKESLKLMKVVDQIIDMYKKAGLIYGKVSFTPHLTVFKTSRASKLIRSLNHHKNKKNQVQEALKTYVFSDEGTNKYSTMDYGTERVFSIDLCNMGRKAHEYYKCHSSVSWAGVPNEHESMLQYYTKFQNWGAL